MTVDRRIKIGIDRVLIIDGDQMMHSLIRNYVEQIGVSEVECALDGKTVEEWIQTRSYDLIVMDWKFKSPPGPELFKNLRSKHHLKEIPIVLMSGSISANDVKQIKPYPFTNFLVKPFTIEILIEVIKKTTNANITKKSPVELGRATTSAQGYSAPAQSENIRITSKSADDFSMTQQNTTTVSGGDLAVSAKQAEGWSIAAGQSNMQGANVNQRIESSFSTEASIPAVTRFSSNFQTGLDTPRPPRPSDSRAAADSSTNTNRPSGLSKTSTVGNVSGENGERATNETNAASPPVDTVRRPPEDIAIPSMASYANNFDSVFTVDADATITRLMENYFANLGSKDISSCGRGDDAWKKVKNKQIQMMVMDWKLDGLSGLALYNKIYERCAKDGLKILVLSGSVESNDFRLLEENAFVRFIRKPFPMEIFTEAIESLVGSHEAYKAATEMAATLLKAWSQGKADISTVILTASKDARKASFVLPILAEALMEHGYLPEAEECLKTAIAKDTRNSGHVTRLSKVYLRMGKGSEAYKLLHLHSHLNSKSVERLCLLGEADLTLQNPAEARNHFKNALVIDEENSTAKAGVTIADNMQKYMEGDGPVMKNLASSLNVIGITLAKKNEIKAAQEQYNAAMAFIHSNDDLSKVSFNMGLSFLRDQDKKSAFDWFSKADELSQGRHEKAVQWCKKLQAELGLTKVAETEKDIPETEKKAIGSTLVYSKKSGRS